VAELMNEEHNGWTMQLVNDMFLPFKAQQIAQIPVVYNQRDEFSVKLAYHFLKQRKEVHQSNRSVIPQHSKIWAKLWKLRTIPRHVHLMWRTLHNRILVRMALFNQGVHCSPICCLCDRNNETAEHLFMHCDWVKTVVCIKTRCEVTQ
jgi:nuclear transport factor 2 (NTF2) superfamily protein